MTISSKDSTILPTPSPETAHLGSFRPMRLKALDATRMAEAEAASDEVVAMCEEISRLMSKPKTAAAKKTAPRGNSNRPSVPARPRRK